MSPICVSVIVPAFNASATIGRTLEALSRQNCFQPFEVIVVDDGSSDDTADIVRSFPSVRYARQDNAGPASARNLGAKMAQGEYLAFTDADCVPHEDWISLLMEGFVGHPLPNPPHKGEGIRDGFPRKGEGIVHNIGVVAGSYGIANPQSLLARCVYKEIIWRHTHLMPNYPNSFGSYNFCVKKNVFDAVGGFNTSYRSASGEDNDLSYKISGSGWRTYFQRKALVDHYHPTQVIKYLKEQYRHGFWRVKMYKDHPRMMRGDGYTFWKDIVEVPVAGCILGALALSACHYIRLNDVAAFFVFPFLVFEILSALVMSSSFFEGIFGGFIFLFRALARALGFSTGILSLLF